MFFLHKKHLTQRKLYTQIAYRSFYRPTFLHAETLPREQFLHNIFFSLRSLYAEKNMHSSFYRQNGFTQKVLRTEGFTHNILTYRRFYTQMSLHRHQLHTETCAHSTRLHSQLLHREALLPLLDHLLFVFPQSNDGEITIPHTILNHHCLEKKHREMDEHAHEPRKHVCISFPSTPPIFVCPYHISWIAR